MHQPLVSILCLVVLCVYQIGCGRDSAEQEPAEPSNTQEPVKPEPLAMVVETSELTYTFGVEDEQAIDYVELLVTNTPEDPAFTIKIDETHDRTDQLRVLLEPTAGSGEDLDLKAEADRLFEEVRAAFDQHAQQAADAELQSLTRQASTLESEVQDAQKKLRTFQETVRGLPSSEEIRLERRKLGRKIETSLQAKIELEKLIEAAQRRIDRKRFVTLLRVR